MVWHNYPYTNVHELNLDWIIKEMSIIRKDIELLNKWKLSRDERDAEIDRQLEDLNRRFVILENLYNTFVDEVNTRFDELALQITTQVNELEERVNNQFAELEADVYAQLTALQRALETEMREFKTDVNSILSLYNVRIINVEQGLQDIINRLPEMFTIIDPYTGLENSIVNVIYEIVNNGKTNSLTAEEYDNKQLTAAYYDGLNVTAYNYDFNGKDYVI